MVDDDPGPAASMPLDAEPAAGASTPFDSVVGRVEAQLARGRPSGPVESPAPRVVAVGRRGPGYATGFVLGACALAVAVDAWLAIAAGRLAASAGYLPSGSRLTPVVASPVWRWGTVLGLAGLVVGAHVLARRGRRWAVVAVAAVVAVVVVVTAYAVSYRVNELTGPADRSGWTFYTPESLGN